MRHKIFIFMALILAAPLSAFAETGAPRIFDLDRGSGTIEFEAVGRPGAIKIHGKGTTPHGTLSVDGPLVSGNLVFNLDSLDTGMKLRNEHMKKKYLETEKFPEAKLTLSKVDLPKDFNIEACSIHQAPFEGTLKLHGVEKLIKGLSKIECHAGRVTLDAHFTLAVDEFNIEIPSFAGITVTKDVNVSVNIQAPTNLAAK